MSDAPKNLFFGCWGESGHYIFNRAGRIVDSRMAMQWGFLTGEDLDGSRIFLPKPAVLGQGCRTYLPSLHLTILSWWNEIYDTRPGVNSHFMMKGRAGDDMMWDTFLEHFAVGKMHTRPTILAQYQ